MPVVGRALITTILLIASSVCLATGTVTSEPESDSYHFVSHYRIQIEAPPSRVWAHLIDLGSWMYEFDMSYVSGARGKAGEVRRLYPEQDFFVQITKAIPEQVLVIANLPSTFNGEASTGVGVITLNEIEGGTIVDLTMSRRYDWLGNGQNPSRNRRESTEFNAVTDATWERFLGRLCELASAT